MPRRLQIIFLRLQNYSFNLRWKNGKQMYTSDTLSRAFITSADDEPTVDECNVEHLALIDDELRDNLKLVASPDTIQQIQTAAGTDETYRTLRDIIKSGWPDSKKQLPQCIQIYHSIRDELIVSNNLVYKGDRIVIPPCLKEVILNKLHKSHQGETATLRFAKDILFMPCLSKEIHRVVSSCDVCQKYQAAQQKEPMVIRQTAERPWQYIGVDVFHFHDLDYLVSVCYLSGWIEIERLPSKRVCDIVRILKAQQSRFGLCEKIFTDNSPFNSAEFRSFAKDYGFEHVTSSPNFPASNGRAEIAVKFAKRLLQKAAYASEDAFIGLLMYRNTPNQAGLSPSDITLDTKRVRRCPLPLNV